MILLLALVIVGALMALAGTVGLAGLQRWGMILFVPVFAGLIAALLGGTAMAMMLLVELIGGTAVRGLYSATDFWSAVLIIAYGLAFVFTAIGFRGEFRRKSPPPPAPEPPGDEVEVLHQRR